LTDQPPSTWRDGVIPLAGGTLALLITGVNPILLGALGEAGRLSAAGIGQAAMLELLAMGVAAGGAGAVLAPERLKLIGVLAGLVIAAANVFTLRASGAEVLMARGAAGLAEGVLIWISIGFIVRQATPERWAGVYFMVQTLSQLVLSAALGGGLMAAFGVNGGFVILAAAGVVAAGLALLGPSGFAPLPKGEGISHLPSPRGWIALGGILIYVASGVAVWIYMQPIAHHARLPAVVAGYAVTASLAGQVAGSTAATIVAGRLRYITVFLTSAVVVLGVWALIAGAPAAPVFVAVFGTTGFLGMFVSPYFVPLLIEADPSRRAAELAGGAQLLGSALGPFMASLLVSDAEPRSALALGVILLVIGVAVIAGLHFTAPKEVRSTPG
jgi:hypothetical protein